MLTIAPLVPLLLMSPRSLVVPAALPAVKDNSMYSESSEEAPISNGAGEAIFAGYTAFANIRRALVAFDLSSIPAGSTIISARLELYCSRTTFQPSDVAVHRATASWGEGASDAEFAEGQGAPAEPGDATWASRFHPGVAWTTPGGDFDPAPSALTNVLDIGPYTWGPTPQLLADVQGWFSNPSSNFGWVLIGNEVELRSAKRFDSRENPVEENRPRLYIEYIPPPGCPGDANGDGMVGLADVAVVITCWGMPASCDPQADLDGSGDIGLGDVAEVIGNWGNMCP